MTQIVSSISGIEIWAPSAGSASRALTDKNGRDLTKCVESATVSAIASGYQVVSSTGSATYYSGGNQTGISGINGSAILAVSSKTASYAANAGYANTCDTANVAMYDSNGRMLSSIGTSTVTLASPLGTIDVAGYDLEGTDSAALPGTAMQSGLYASQTVYYDDPYMGTVLFAPDKYKAALFFSSDSYEGITINTTGYRSPDDYENSATTSIPYGSNTAWVEWTASAVEAIAFWVSAANYANLNIYSAIESKDVVKLAHESAVIPWSALSGDGTSITGISGSAIGGGGGATGDYVEKSSIMVDIGSGNTSYTSNSAVFIQGYDNNNNGNNFVFIQGRRCTAGDGTTFLQGEQNSGGDSYSFAQGGSNRSKRSLVQGTTNTAFAYSLAQGNENQAYDSSLAQGNRNTASSCSLAQGCYNRAYGDSFAQGVNNQAYDSSLAQGGSNIASSDSMAQGYYNRAYGDSFAQGEENTASSVSVSLGLYNSANNYSIAHGFRNSASNFGVAVGMYSTAANTAAVFGQYNLHGDGDVSTGDSAAFVIGDGTDTAARHDLMVVTKDGEITMYSSTADAVGTGIMSSIRAISAAATGGGGGGIDSATCSAIASSYAESAASSRMYSSAMQVVASSSQATATGVLYILTGGV